MFGGVIATCLALSVALEPDAAMQLEANPQAARALLVQHPTLLRMLELQNLERARYGLHPLKISPDMCVAAQRHAHWMASTGWYVHSNLGWPEIIHSGPIDPTGAVNGWIYSPAHHAIMLSGGTEAGLGYSNKNGTPFWVTVVR
ncbi:MAG: CAP domain-containing protein [Planctomycetota bacterium]|nr:CAP domain-containing protein [Planctomycetota bacterium]